MCLFPPVFGVHRSPGLDKQALAQHGFHSVADSWAGTACLPDPLTLVSLLVDGSSPSPVAACRMCCLPSVEVAGGPAADLS